MARKAKSFCRNCGALCSMELTIEGDKLIGVVGDGTASPYGSYMCPKGRASVDFHNGAENRLLHSLKRDPSGQFKELPAAQAMDEIAAKLASLIHEHGPRSLAFYHGTGAYRSVLGGLLERAFASAIGSPNFFSTMTIDQSAKWVTAGRMGVMASGKPSTRDIDLAVVVGNNPLVSHQTLSVRPGRKRLAGQIVRRSQSARRTHRRRGSASHGNGAVRRSVDAAFARPGCGPVRRHRSHPVARRDLQQGVLRALCQSDGSASGSRGGFHTGDLPRSERMSRSSRSNCLPSGSVKRNALSSAAAADRPCPHIPISTTT